MIAFHVLAWVFVLLFRKNMTFQSAVFLTLCVLVRLLGNDIHVRFLFNLINMVCVIWSCKAYIR